MNKADRVRIQHWFSNLYVTHKDISMWRKPQHPQEPAKSSHRDHTGNVSENIINGIIETRAREWLIRQLIIKKLMIKDIFND